MHNKDSIQLKLNVRYTYLPTLQCIEESQVDNIGVSDIGERAVELAMPVATSVSIIGDKSVKSAVSSWQCPSVEVTLQLRPR